MIEYTIAEGAERRDLIAEVERLLAEGWEFQGGVCLTCYTVQVARDAANPRIPVEHVYRLYTQAMVRWTDAYITGEEEPPTKSEESASPTTARGGGLQD